MDRLASVVVKNRRCKKFQFVVTILSKFGLHFFTEGGIPSIVLSIYSLFILTTFCAISNLVNCIQFDLRLEAMTLVGTPKFGMVASLIDTARVILLNVSLLTHPIVVILNRDRFMALYSTPALVYSELGKGMIIFITIAILMSRLGMFTFMMIKVAEVFRRYVNFSYEIAMTIGTYGLFLVVLHYCVIIEVYTEQMNQLAEVLRRSFDTHDCSIKSSTIINNSRLNPSVSSNYPDQRYLTAVIKKHSSLLQQLEKIQSLFGWQLAMCISFVFIESTVNLYYAIYVGILEMLKRFFLRHLIYFIQNLLRGALLACFLSAIVHTLELTNESVDAFYRELFRLMRESKTLCSNKKLCLYVSMRKTVNFTACGFFNLGYPLITSIIAAATTYLVILVQFSIPK